MILSNHLLQRLAVEETAARRGSARQRPRRTPRRYRPTVRQLPALGRGRSPATSGCA